MSVKGERYGQEYVIEDVTLMHASPGALLWKLLVFVLSPISHVAWLVNSATHPNSCEFLSTSRIHYFSYFG